MKHLKHLVWLLLLPALTYAQDAPPTLFENFYFSVKAGHGADLEAAMAAHNQKYHGPGAYRTQVYSVMNGPNAGMFVWSMGPSSWAAHENRPDDDAHTQDWDQNVGIHIEEYGPTEYWKMDTKYSWFPASFDLNRLSLWKVDIKSGQMYRANAIFEKVRAVHEALGNVPWGVYRQQLKGSHGADLAIVWFFDSLEWFDADDDFAPKFDEMYGDGSFERMVDEWVDIVESREDEVWTFVPDMSGHDGKGISRGN